MTTKRCPSCAEEILSAAIVCKHCGRDVPVHGAAQRVAVPVEAPRRPRSLWRVVAYAFIAAIGVSIFSVAFEGAVVERGQPAPEVRGQAPADYRARVREYQRLGVVSGVYCGSTMGHATMTAQGWQFLSVPMQRGLVASLALYCHETTGRTTFQIYDPSGALLATSDALLR